MEAFAKPQIELYQENATLLERRKSRRFRLPSHLPVRIGRRDGILVDLSTRGARVRHSGSLELGTELRLSFVFEQMRFSASARVLASRVVGFGTIDGAGTSYESRLSFGDLPEEMMDVVKTLLQGT
jgi:hypothetical protein